MKQIFFFIFLFLNVFQSFAGGENLVAGAKQTALGGTNVSSQNVFSAHNNVAGIAYVKQLSFGLFASRPFLVKGINNFNLVSVIPIQEIGAFGIDLNYFGYAAYNETRAGLSYARKFGDIVSAGLKFDYLSIGIVDHTNKKFFAFGIGLQYQPIKQLRIGANVYNPISMNVDTSNDEKIATNFTLGIRYIPSEKLNINIDAEKEINQDFRLKVGIEYRPLKPLFLRLGAATNPTLITFGIGTEFKNFKLDASASWHLQLGISPQLSFIYNFKKKEKKVVE